MLTAACRRAFPVGLTHVSVVRTLPQLKLKFKREERQRKDLVDAALRSSGSFDYENYKRMVEDALGASPEDTRKK